MINSQPSEKKLEFDHPIQDIVDYVMQPPAFSELAYETARLCLLDSLGCALLALNYPACTRLLGPVVPGTHVPSGSRVVGTDYCLDPVTASFNNGMLIRWLDFNDTWLAAEWGHPSDNLGGILAVADYVSQCRINQCDEPLVMLDILKAMIQAHEIQGVLALHNSFNRVGLDHVILVKVATTAVVSKLLGATREQALNAVSLAWVDGQSLRTYRHTPNTGSRKSWAAGDATARGVQLALMAIKGEMGYPTALSAPTWGFYDVSFNQQPFELNQPFGCYVMENILFKIAFPAEFHAQTAVEAAIQLHATITDIASIERIDIQTHQSAIRIIDKQGPLSNPADRDHCLQYMVAIGLLFGELTADHYEADIACDPRIDALRSKMVVTENSSYTEDYSDPDKRTIANAIQITFSDGSQSDWVEVHYPLGHRRRREEGIPYLLQKFKDNASTQWSEDHIQQVASLCVNKGNLDTASVTEWIGLVTC